MASQTLLSYEDFHNFYQENRLVARYDSAIEAKIPHDWWTLDHDEILRRLKEISEMTTSVMQSFPRDDVEVQVLLDMGDSVYKVKKSRSFIVALSGPQAAGKSSFLNSLLDCPGLCLSGADGRACTNAVIRYVHYCGDTEDAVRAEIIFHHTDRLKEIVEENARAFYHFYHFTTDGGDGNDDHDSDDDSVRKKKYQHDEADVKAKDTAQDIFETVFGSREKFMEAWSADGFTDGSFQKEALRKCAEAIYKMKASTDGILIYNASTPTELSRKLKPFTTKVVDEVSLWPLVDTIKYGLNRELLGQGFEFVDLPGWGDRNAAKERHADEIRDAVDLEMIFIDTSRITTENTAINNIRAALQGRGAEGVIIVATKVDSLSDTDLDQCEGTDFDLINSRMQWVEDRSIEAADEGNDEEERNLLNYSTYLKRARKSVKVAQRCTSIDSEFGGKFEDIVGTNKVHIFHVSATEYLKWISKPKHPYAKQPDLSPADTGIPGLRKHLFDIPAASNIRDVRNQVFQELDSFLEKIDQVVNEKDRSESFKTLAAEFAGSRESFAKRMQHGLKNIVEDSLDNLMSNPEANAQTREDIDALIQSQWLRYPHGTFNRVLKEHGFIPKGISRAQCLKEGCDWNQDLSAEFVDLFKVWKFEQKNLNEKLGLGLANFYRQFHSETRYALQHSKSDLSAIATARNKWMSYKKKLLSHQEHMVKELEQLQGHFYRKALMMGGRQNSLVPLITGPLFDKIYKSLPAEKPQSTPKKRLYVEPKHKHQKNLMVKLFCNPMHHIFDQGLRVFRNSVKVRLITLLDNSIADADGILASFQQNLQALVPIPYEVKPQGQKVRDALRNMLPDLRNKGEGLQNMVPREIVPEYVDDEAESQVESQSFSNDLTYFLNKVTATRGQSQLPMMRKQKRKEVEIKQEPEEEECFFMASLPTNKKRKIY